MAKSKKDLKKEIEDIENELTELYEKRAELRKQLKTASEKTAGYFLAYQKAQETYEAEKNSETPDKDKLKSLEEKMDEKKDKFDDARKKSNKLQKQIDENDEETDELEEEQEEKEEELEKLEGETKKGKSEVDEEEKAEEKAEKEDVQVKKAEGRPHWTQLNHFGFHDDRSLDEKINSVNKVFGGLKNLKYQQLGKDKHIFDIEMPNGDTYMIDVKENKVMINSANMNTTTNMHFLVSALKDSGVEYLDFHPDQSNLHDLGKALLVDIATQRKMQTSAPSEIYDKVIQLEELRKSSAVQELLQEHGIKPS